MRILELRTNPVSKSNGIVKYCKDLREMFLGDAEINILPIENLPMKRSSFLREIYTDLTFDKLIRNTDIVHINGYAAFVVFQALLSAIIHRKKIIYTAHWHPFHFLNHPVRAKLFFNILIKPLVKHFADVVVTLNNEDTSFFKRIHHNVVQIPHWISSLPDNKSECIDKIPNMILFVGRISDENKGIEHLFHLPEGKYEIHCVGAGKRELRSDMIHHLNISNEELNLLYTKASLLVVPSKYEAFSYVALEALALGTPVLMSERVRIYDYLRNLEGVDTFRYHDFDDFNKKVEYCIGSTVNSVEIKKFFSKDRIKEMYKNLFNTLC